MTNSYVPLLFLLFRRLADDDTVAWWGMAVTVCSPLFWFTALRPLSDMVGLAFAVASQWLVLSAWCDGRNPPARRMLVAGAVLCGVGAGVRVQTLMLTAPLLLAVLAWPGTSLSLKDRGIALVGALAGAVAWVVPLLAASGGLGGYLAARDSRTDGTLRWIVEQGFEMGRPSILEVEVDKKNGKTTAARVGGKTVIVCEGEMEL